MKKNSFFLSMAVTAAMLVGCSQSDPLMDTPESNTRGAGDLGEFTTSSKNDSLALVAIYDALGGSKWSHSYWKRTPLRYWEGVKLANINDEVRVVSLFLAGNDVKGQLPKEIGMLTELKSLKICHSDNLTGSIVDGVYDLTKLKVLDFRFTGLTGELSPRIGQLAQLDTLVLWKGQFEPGYTDENGKPAVSWDRNTVLFSGSVPPEIGQLTQLKELNFARCGFTGELPEELGNLKSITRLDLSDCRFTGQIPTTLGNLQELSWLALCKNNLTGSIPAELCDAQNMHTLIVSDNQLTGTIPSEVVKMTKLSHFSVADNKLTGEIPVSMEDNARLGIFYAENNQLSGPIPSQLGRRHPFLVVVNLTNNQLTGSLPDITGNDLGSSGIWTCVFYATNNRLTGDVPALWLRYPDMAREYLLPQQAGYGFDNLK